MKVLLVEAYPGFRGAQRSLAALLEGLRRSAAVDDAEDRVHANSPASAERVEVDILCLAPGRAHAAFSQERASHGGISVHLLAPPAPLGQFGGALASGPPWRRWVATACLVPYTWTLRRFLRQRQPDIVHCNQARGVLLVAMAARTLGLPVVWHQRGMLDLPPIATRLAGLASRHLLCVSEAVRRSLPEPLARRASVIHNGIDRPAAAPEKSPLRRRLGIDAELAARHLEPGSLVLVTASSFLPYKGLHHVVEALARIASRAPEMLSSLLWIVLGDDDGQMGKKAYRQGLRSTLEVKNLTRHVYWAGWQQEPSNWLAAADLCLLPTVADERWVDADGRPRRLVCSEGFPRTVLEAMAVGTAVIASDVAAVGEQIVDGESGLVLPPGDAEALAEAIVALGRDAPRRHALVAAGQQRVERFSIEAMTQQTVAFWRRCLGDRRPQV